MLRYISIFFLVLITACKKHEIIPIPTSNSPVFRVEGTIANDSVNYIAGENNFELNNEILNVNNVSIFSVELKDENYGIELLMYDGNIDRKTNKYDTLNIVDKLLYVPLVSEPLFSISKNDFSNADKITSIQWNIEGQQNSAMNNLQIYEPGKYTICASINFNDGTTSSLCEEIIVGFKRNADYSLKLTQYSNQQFLIKIDEIRGAVQSYQWFLDGILISENQHLESLNVAQGFHVVTSKVTFLDGFVKEKSVLIDGSSNGRNIGSFSQIGNYNGEVFDFKTKLKVLINQQEYTSEHAENTSNKITIDNSVFYKLSTKGNPIYKVTGSMNGMLKAVNSNDLKPYNLNFVLGIEIPK